MGSEQSGQREKRDESNRRAMNIALEQQRKLYEERCKELLKQQQKLTSEKHIKIVLESSKNSTQNQTNSPISNHLYPNLQNTPDFAVQSTSNYNPNISNNNPYNNENRLQYGTMNNHQPSAPLASVSSITPVTSGPSTNSSRAHNRNKIEAAKCVSCGNKFGVKIFQCKSGHSSCMVCKARAMMCGICKNPICDIRNIALENMIEGLLSNTEKVGCPNKNDGCKLFLKQETMEDHLKECPYREMACPVAYIYGGCFWRGKINQLTSHFLDCHPDQAAGNVDTELSINISANNHIVHHVTMGKFNFLVHINMAAVSQTIFMVIQLIGTRSSASKWRYEFHVYNKSEPRRKFFYSDICHSNSIPVDDICKQSNCAVLPMQYASTYLNDNKLAYKFYIKRDVQETNNRIGRERRPNNYNNNNES